MFKVYEICWLLYVCWCHWNVLWVHADWDVTPNFFIKNFEQILSIVAVEFDHAFLVYVNNGKRVKKILWLFFKTIDVSRRALIFAEGKVPD